MLIKTYNFSVKFSCIEPSSGRTNYLTFKGNFVVLMKYMYHLFRYVIASLIREFSGGTICLHHFIIWLART